MKILKPGFRKTRVFLKKPNPGGFFLGFIGFFWTCSASGCLSKHGKGKCMTEDLLFIS